VRCARVSGPHSGKRVDVLCGWNFPRGLPNATYAAMLDDIMSKS